MKALALRPAAERREVFSATAVAWPLHQQRQKKISGCVGR